MSVDAMAMETFAFGTRNNHRLFFPPNCLSMHLGIIRPSFGEHILGIDPAKAYPNLQVDAIDLTGECICV